MTLKKKLKIVFLCCILSAGLCCFGYPLIKNSKRTVFHTDETSPSTNSSASVNMPPDTNDLVYRFYGENAVSADMSCTIRLDHIQSLLSSKEVKGIFLYHYEQDSIKEYCTETDTIEYKVEENGTYGIYAVMQDDETINLSAYIYVDYDTDACIDESDDKEKTVADRIINL